MTPTITDLVGDLPVQESEDLAKFQRRISARISEMGRLIDGLAVSGMMSGRAPQVDVVDSLSLDGKIDALNNRITNFHEAIIRKIDSDINSLKRQIFPTAEIKFSQLELAADLTRRIALLERQIQSFKTEHDSIELRLLSIGKDEASYVETSADLAKRTLLLEKEFELAKAEYEKNSRRLVAFDENVQHLIDLRISHRNLVEKSDGLERWLVYQERKTNELEGALRDNLGQQDGLQSLLAEAVLRVSSLEEQMSAANRKLGILTSASSFARAVCKRVGWRLRGSPA